MKTKTEKITALELEDLLGGISLSDAELEGVAGGEGSTPCDEAIDERIACVNNGPNTEEHYEACSQEFNEKMSRYLWLGLC